MEHFMPASRTIPIRLTEEKWDYYSDRARQEQIGLSTLLRRRLEQGDDVATRIETLGHRLDEIAASSRSQPEIKHQPHPASSSGNLDDGMLLETLLLLRAVVSPEKLGMVQAEVNRQGLPVWGPGK
jgi:hypothetical protein